jgi:hypothetical protein
MASDVVRRARAAIVLVVIAALALPSLASAQRGSRTVSIARARSTFETMATARRELRSLDVQPADANGAVAAWDRRWARPIARMEREAMGACLDMLADRLGAPADCRLRETIALFCHVAYSVSMARRSIYDRIPEGDGDVPDEFEARQAIADEAARRREARLSCEDLPDHTEIRGSASSGWTRLDGTPLIPERSAPRSPLPGDALDDAAREALRAASPAFAPCLRSGEPVTVHIAVAPGGSVEDVRTESAAGTNVCIERVVRGLAFTPRDGTTRYVVDLGARPAAP